MRSNDQPAQSAFRRFLVRQKKKHDWLFLLAVVAVAGAVLLVLLLSPTLAS